MAQNRGGTEASIQESVKRVNTQFKERLKVANGILEDVIQSLPEVTLPSREKPKAPRKVSEPTEPMPPKRREKTEKEKKIENQFSLVDFEFGNEDELRYKHEMETYQRQKAIYDKSEKQWDSYMTEMGRYNDLTKSDKRKYERAYQDYVKPLVDSVMQIAREIKISLELMEKATDVTDPIITIQNIEAFHAHLRALSLELQQVRKICANDQSGYAKIINVIYRQITEKREELTRQGVKDVENHPDMQALQTKRVMTAVSDTIKEELLGKIDKLSASVDAQLQTFAPGKGNKSYEHVYQDATKDMVESLQKGLLKKVEDYLNQHQRPGINLFNKDPGQEYKKIIANTKMGDQDKLEAIRKLAAKPSQKKVNIHDDILNILKGTPEPTSTLKLK